MKVLAAILLSIGLAGCAGYVATPTAEIAYEPDVLVGDYAVGYYREGFGYWTGNGWDANFYAHGHPGWGHYYRGAPREAVGVYRGGPHYRRWR
ncbi:hypothetical protein BN59_00706 [Legionella massiliensis]|uniref:Lipoprotein n=1 Tax=Legionella massiliensis TaxID=1034943 RepID=A0A078KU08_9GAMM|nr:hypothetical protein [Legionella massiliensis]CDZ76437.1 hypothetical protein BN59_00706 [Legionella massiliensis]CEE12175.1 hypothetical protein BN1094_00706 [Legionella massiliensis]